jgi:hypothetical protein
LKLFIKYNNESEFIETIRSAQLKLSTLKIEQSLRYSDIDFSDPSDWVRNFEKNNDLGNMFVFFFLYKKMSNSTVHLHISSLEHTLPQSPSEENWPIIKNISEDEIKRHIYSLGNFFVTHSRDNSSYGNKSFDKKAAMYKTDNIFDIIDDSNPLNYKSVVDWTYETILQREKVIIELFKEFQD